MAEVSSAVIVVNGGNIIQAEFSDLYVRANEPDMLISILGSGAERMFNITVENVNPSLTIINGSVPGSIKNGSNHVSFTTMVAPRLVKTITLTPAENLENFTFVVLGDGRDNPDIFQQILTDGASFNPLFIIILGDMVNSGNREEYDELVILMEASSAPVLTMPGNHDIKNSGREYYSQIFGTYYHSFDVGSTHFILLDNAKGAVDNAQMEWLRQDLEQNNASSILVFMHIPPFDPRPDQNYAMTDTNNSQDLVSLFEQFQVDMVFSGHIHSYLQETRNGVHYVITGGGGAPLVQDLPGHHYVLMNVSNENITKQIFLV
ncbi:MAG: metallophosphoesterase [ANME-2 cluster archaeon]|nr:metallophosphoesterase [ANME-2 cluster archaeon]